MSPLKRGYSQKSVSNNIRHEVDIAEKAVKK